MNDHRESAIDRMLRQGAGGPSMPATSVDCLDGEALAAWMSRSLPAAESTRIEHHLADCERCQSLVSVFVRTEPAAGAIDVEPWWRRLQVRWLVPLATAVVALAVWVALPAERDDVPAPAMAKREEAPVAPMPEPQTEPQEPISKLTDTLQDQRPAQSTQASRAAGSAVAPARRRQELAAAPPAQPAAPLAQGPPVTSIPPAAAPVAAAPAPATVGELAGAPAAPPASPPSALEERVIVTGQSPALVARAPAAFDVVAADRAMRWRIMGGNRIQRSTDGGARWQTLDFTAESALTAGHSPAANVLWLVGARGAVYVTTDGATFERVPFVEGTDLMSVVAVDGQRATVSAADGRTWRTTDRGQTWIQP